ncbi:MAG: helix-turn-helix domain-containing protein [Aminivibrio sp.]
MLDCLQSGESITQTEAGERLGIMRLASRVSELRSEGWNIKTEMVPAGEALVAMYTLDLNRPRIERRFLPVQEECIPGELKALPRWVLWRAVIKPERIDKVPYSLDGHKAKSNDPRTWGGFHEVYAAYEHGQGDGIGFVFSEIDDVIGVDLDRCIDDNGALIPQARAIVEDLGSYAEYSISGKGVHVICRADLAKGMKVGPVEVYPSGRYFTVSGHALEGRSEIRNSQGAIDRLVRLLRPPKKESQKRTGGHYVSNDDLVNRAMSAKNGAKFTALWNGDISGYKSASEADLALLAILWYWTNGDEGRVDLLFRQSGLCRDKWTERADYRRRCFDRLRSGGE